MQTLRVNNSIIIRIKNAFSGYYFYINTNIYGDFQICISVTLNSLQVFTYLVSTPKSFIKLKDLASLAKWLDVRLRTKWLWVLISLLPLNVTGLMLRGIASTIIGKM